MKKVYFFIAACFLLCATNAQTIRAVFFNPPGTDNGTEYVEISHTASTTLTNMHLLEIEGDGGNGNINSAINLNMYSTGTNGLLLIRDAVTALVPAPSAATNVVVFDFSPDLQNGTTTFILVTGFTGVVGDDLDPDNDGTLNTTPWASVQGAVSATDGGATDDQYADDVGGVNLPDIAAFAAEAIIFYNSGYWAIDVSGTTPGPFNVDAAWDASGTRNTFVELLALTPGNTGNPLPVTFASFSGYKDGSSNQLRWTTATELDNLGFDVQRSTNGINYVSIGFVNSLALNGNSSDLISYSFTDNAPAGTRQYYRLRQQDLNGQGKLSNIVLIKGAKPSVLTIESVFPNPAKNTVNVIVSTPVKDNITVMITDMAGRLVSRKTVNAETGSNTVPVDISHLQSGNYMVRVACSEGCEMATAKFVKQ